MPMWTNAQEKAIYEPSGEGNILISAAAGSGKTAVLVERIVEMITRGENPVSVDELLVVTFTEAAAAEMRERIIKRINKAYREAIDLNNTDKAKYLKEQIHLTGSADINTIDSFCLNVVKNNFHVLGIDPNFGIMDNSEGEMLSDDAMTELFSELYTTDNEEDKERFTYLVNTYASNRDDEGLKKIIRKVYRFVQSFPQPWKWLHEKAQMYSADMTESKWLSDIVLRDKRLYIVSRHKVFWNELMSEMREKADGCEEEKYWGKLWSNVSMCSEAVGALEIAEDWDSIDAFYETYIAKKAYLGNAINKIPAKKEASDEQWQKYYDEYNLMRDDLREQCLKLPHGSKEEFNKYIHAEEIKKTVDSIVWLTEHFNEKFEAKKTRRSLKSFSDVEHLAYRLFADNENIRGEYSDRYAEILIDEFQDTNGLQEAIFSAISRGGKNMFMVGDLKQSIYRFRGGDPTIFKEKSQSYASENTDGKKIMLSENFRSRMEVIRSVNAVFEKVMSPCIGDVMYTGGEALERSAEREVYEGRANPSNDNHRGYYSELHHIAVIGGEEESDTDISAAAGEGAQIADRIRSLIDGHFQVYRGDGAYSDIEYRDIVILARSVRTDGDVLRTMLESRGIPAFVQKDEYFERREIKLMLSLITLINNHMQDIPLVAVMRSPIGGFSENELAIIRAESRGKTFYNSVRYYKTEAEKLSDKEEKIRRKCRRFLSDLDRWRGYVKMKSIASLIWTLYEETGFYDFMGALEGGEEAQANLKLLYERAKRYEESGFKGIFNFIRYIERMENSRDDLSGAKLVNENHNVVRIMTIHKSKGLEFPVVFLARTAKRMAIGLAGEETRIMLHKDMGIGIDYYNYEDMYCKKLMFNEYIKEANKSEQMSEEMRLMYVAMTRAKEKLIVMSTRKFADRDKYEEYKESLLKFNSMDKVPLIFLEGAKCYSDWITAAVRISGNCWIESDDEIVSVDDCAIDNKEYDDIVIENAEEMKNAVEKILEFRYSYPRSGEIPAKTSVTAIKEMSDEEHIHEDDPVYMTQKPAFMRDEKRGARIGTAHHQVMAYIDIEKMKAVSEDGYEDFVRKEIERITSDGQIDEEIIEDSEISDMICSNVCGFFRSNMGKALFEAKKIYRERPFEIAISANDYDKTLPKEYENEKVILQGIIDLYFETSDGDIILVDYKTDRCSSLAEQRAIAEKYRKQLELYARAMEKILKKSVKDKYLYLFSAQSVIELD